MGAIDATVSRELFVRSALVEEVIRKPNVCLLQAEPCFCKRKVEELEHKSRRRDILIDDDELFDFYDQRVGEESRVRPSLRYMVEEDSRKHLNWTSKSRCCSAVMLATLLIWITRTSGTKNGIKLKPSYQFEPGDDNDGVTVHIPLPILNQIDQNGFWLADPRPRQELVISLIKSLPKRYAVTLYLRQTTLVRSCHGGPPLTPLLDSLERAAPHDRCGSGAWWLEVRPDPKST